MSKRDPPTDTLHTGTSSLKGRNRPTRDLCTCVPELRNEVPMACGPNNSCGAGLWPAPNNAGEDACTTK
jgi:hypothetical protein